MAQTTQTVLNTQEEFEKILKLKDAEINILKEKIVALESEVAQAQKLKTQRGKETEEVEALKIQSEGILTKAKAMIFENTKVIKNQELQLEALSQQNESLKDVVNITKDLLEIRNLEVKQLEAKIQCMEDRVKAEKTRQDLLHKKLETMIRHNGELKREYEAQLCLFNALRERYNEKELAQGVVTDLRRDVVEARAEQQNGEADNPANDAVENQANPVAESQENPVNEAVENQANAVAKSQDKPVNEAVENQANGITKGQENPVNVVVENQTSGTAEIQDKVVAENSKDGQNQA